MLVLVTNDDGIGSPGLRALADALSPRHEVVVAAPDRDRSGASHCITVGGAVTARPAGPGRWALDGTPADCVRVGVPGLLEGAPGFVVSGINLGANFGTDLAYSGTAGAARQAAFMGIPAAAVSVHRYRRPEDADAAARFMAAALPVLAALVPPGSFVNVNVPVRWDGRVRLVRPGLLRYRTVVSGSAAEDGARCFLPAATLQPPEEGDSEDLLAVESGAVSLSAIGTWGPDPEAESVLRRALAALEALEL